MFTGWKRPEIVFAIWSVLALLAGLGADWLVTQFTNRVRVNTSVLVTGVLVLVLLLPSMFSAYQRDLSFFLIPDTRQQALHWIEQNVPANTHILREWGTPEVELSPQGYLVDSAPAVFDTTTVDFDIAAREQPQIGRRAYLFRSTGSIIKFPGFLAVYRESVDDAAPSARSTPSLLLASTCCWPSDSPVRLFRASSVMT